MAIISNNPHGENPLVLPVPITDVHVNQAVRNLRATADDFIIRQENRIEDGETAENRFNRIETERVRVNAAFVILNRTELANPQELFFDVRVRELVLLNAGANPRWNQEARILFAEQLGRTNW